MSAKMSGITDNPLQPDGYAGAINNPDADPRPAYSALSMIDFDNWIHLTHILTNDTIYAGYERLPFDRDDFGGGGGLYSSFMALYPVGRRNVLDPINDVHKLGIAVDKKKGATWYIDGTEVFTINRLGQRPNPEASIYQIEGTQQVVSIRNLNVGFGHFSALDGMQPGKTCSAPTIPLPEHHGLSRISGLPYIEPCGSTSAPTPAMFVQDENPVSARLYGQGAVLKIRQLKVEYRC